MLILARNSLSLTRFFLRKGIAKFDARKFVAIGRGMAKNSMFVSFYSSDDKELLKVASKKEEEVASMISEVEGNKTGEKNEEGDKISLAATTLNSTVISTVTQRGSSSKEEEAGGESKEEDNSWQTMKYTFTIFGITFTVVGLFLLMEFGAATVDDDGKVVEDEYSNMSLPLQYIYRTVKQLNYYRKLINEPSRDKLLPDELKYPYHQPPYTLVLEFKDVLVHPDWTYSTGWRFKKRPGIDQFLETLNGIYEIVIYTAELGMTVFPILEILDPHNLITYKLVRDATNFIDGHHVKELDKLNRNLSKVIMVDWDATSVRENHENVLKIARWDGNDHDTALLDLANFLRVIAMSDILDVRDVLRYYSQFEDPIATFKEKQRELERTMYSSNK